MLRIVTGPFHPDLESALVSDLRRLKSPDSLAPLAVIVPSDSLRDHLKRLLCLEQGLSLINVHILTFHQLALRLLSERRPFDFNRLRSPLYFHELVRHLLRRQPAGSSWHALGETPGAWSALYATLKDLKDAAVDPDRVADVWSQRWPGQLPEPQPLWLLYRQFLEMRRRLSAWDADDLASLATAEVPRSAFLAGLHHALYYGFYDLTQVQLDFFRAVTAIAAATVYFPLVDGQAEFLFAQRFYDAHIRGLGGSESPARRGAKSSGRQLALFDETLSEPASKDRGVSVTPGLQVVPRVMCAGNPLDEVTTVAKDILSLVEDRGYRFADIGIVVRSMAGYDDVLARVCAEQGVPIAGDLGRPLGVWPSVNVVLQLLAVRASDFHRDDVLELLSSPFFRCEAVCPDPAAARPDLWTLAVRRLGITKGRDEWRRLTRFVDQGLPLRDGDEDYAGSIVAAEQVRLLCDTFTGLADAMETIPDSGSWTEYVDRLHTLADRLLAVDHSSAGESEADPLAVLFEVLDQLRHLDDFSERVLLHDFVTTARRAVEGARLSSRAAQGYGVQVLDAMAARGLSFRALYVLGLNEKSFPRFIHEDAFLRDAVRHMLEQDIGYKIEAKLAGYEEERLLFALLRRSAREYLMVSYQRADRAGRPLAPSGYVDDLCRESLAAVQYIPRRPAARFETVPQYRIACLTEAELATRSLLERRMPVVLYGLYPGGLLLERSLPVLQAQERMERRLGAYDALIGAASNSWQTLLSRGFSPTALQRYASCPFQFFAASILHLDHEDIDSPGDPIGPLEQGTLAHRILRRWMEESAEVGAFGTEKKVLLSDPLDRLDDCARAVFADYESDHPVGYTLTWELRQRELMTFLREAARLELAELDGRWQPWLFEHPVNGVLTVDFSDESIAVPIKGRLDRVDRSPQGRLFRIVDYKFKRTREPKPYETNLGLAAVRGDNLQPPLYLLMAEAALAADLGAPPPTCDGVWFYYLAPEWKEPLKRVAFPGDAWRSPMFGALSTSLTRIFTGIRDGLFFIAPHASVCGRCDFGALCRRTHQPSAWRARADTSVTQSHRALRRAQLPGSGDQAPLNEATSSKALVDEDES
ncbi:MAG: exodeoxyribonuclease V subunit gamma [Nitrospira sp.]